jgi:hypothetical protein
VAPTVIDLTGPINKGNQAFTNLTYTFSNTASADGWNLVGNPYPSTIKWDATSWTRSNISSTVWVWDVVAAAWKSYDYSTGLGSLTNGLIATGQAFWVQATAASPSMTVTEAAKTSPSGAYYREAIPQVNALTVNMSNGMATDQAFVVALSEGSPKSVQPSYKLSLGIEDLSLAITDGKDRFQQLPVTQKDLSNEIPLSVIAKEGEYVFSFETKGTDYFSDYYLFDAVTGDITPLNQTYSFSIRANEVLTGRFLLTKDLSRAKNVESITLYPNPVTDILHVTNTGGGQTRVVALNSQGAVVREFILPAGNSSHQISVYDMPQGMYFFKIMRTGLITETIKITKH